MKKTAHEQPFNEPPRRLTRKQAHKHQHCAVTPKYLRHVGASYGSLREPPVDTHFSPANVTRH